MKTRKIFTLLIAITLVLGMITGCGNNDAKASDDVTASKYGLAASM